MWRPSSRSGAWKTRPRRSTSPRCRARATFRTPQRSKALQDADRTRRLELDLAKRTHDEALTSSQQRYRTAVDDAVIGERRSGRDGERAYLEALRFGEAAARAAKTAADQTLLAALSAIDEARAILRSWRAQLSVIANETAEAETEEFSRFRSELQKIKV